MKKNILFILTILVFSTSLISCSSSDDDKDNDDSNGTVNGLTCSRNYTDNAIYKVYNQETSYNEKNKKLNIAFDFVVNTSAIFGDYHLAFRFLTDINTLKIGDELQIEYVRFKNYTVVGDIAYDNYIKSGRVVVRDIVDKKISIEFHNLDIWREQSYLGGDNSKEIKEIIIRKGVLDLDTTK